MDRIRIHADTNDNLRVNPNNGAIAATDPDLTSPDIADPNVTATAYTSSFPGTTRTQLYGIDTGDDSVVEFETPAPSFQNETRVSPLGLDATDGAELDISSRNRSLAVLRTGTAAPKLYQVDINATANPLQDIGTIGGAADPVEELAVAPRLRTFVGITTTVPQSLVRFRSDRPEAATNVDVGGLPMGVSLVGIDTRNENGTLVGVGSDDKLYRVDPDTGQASVFFNTPFTPGLNGSRFGVDFNPTVDRLRVVSDLDQNKRINPDTGANVDDPMIPGAEDGALNPGNPNVVGSAYTNPKADAQDTQLFGIDSDTDQLVLQNPPNDGTLTNVGALGFDAAEQVGYDIVPEFNQGFAALDPTGGDGQSNLYSVNSVRSPAPGGPGQAVLIGAINTPGGLVDGLAFLNDDVLSLGSSSVSVDENGGNASVTVLRSGDAEAAVSATVSLTPFSATGADYGAPNPATVSFAPGETVKTVTIPIANDTADEPNESFAVSLGSPTNGAGIGKPSAARVTILDDDPTPPGGGGGSGGGGSGSGTNVINGTNGNDTINGTSGNDVINCGDGNDVVNGGGGDDVINCGRGNDRIRGGSGNDRINGGSGNDRIDGDSGNDRIRGGSGNDRINGGSGDDRINGDAGNDRISGGTGDDRISGGSGNDRISGGNGRDRLSGDSGRDRISGNDGRDRLSGGSGNDRLSGGDGRDRLSGGPGRDRSRQ